MLDELDFVIEQSLKMEYRMDYLERMKYEIQRKCWTIPTPRILKDITKLFQIERTICYDHIVLFVNTYKMCTPIDEWDKFITDYLKEMQLIFHEPDIFGDPIIEVETFTFRFRAPKTYDDVQPQTLSK